MSIFVIGDTHLSLGVEKPMDIFGGWDNYMEKLKTNWQDVVKQDDTVIIPGDVSWGMSLQESYKDFLYLNNLNGNKILLKGNHDYWWSTKNKIDGFFKENGLTTIKILHNNSMNVEGVNICGTRGWIFENGEKQDQKIILREAGRLKLSLDDAIKNNPNNETIAFLHYPPIYCNQISKEILDVLMKYNIKKCFYGHIHAKGCKFATNKNVYGIDFKLISADYLNFIPYKIK